MEKLPMRRWKLAGMIYSLKSMAAIKIVLGNFVFISYADTTLCTVFEFHSCLPAVIVGPQLFWLFKKKVANGWIFSLFPPHHPNGGKHGDHRVSELHKQAVKISCNDMHQMLWTLTWRITLFLMVKKSINYAELSNTLKKTRTPCMILKVDVQKDGAQPCLTCCEQSDSLRDRENTTTKSKLKKAVQQFHCSEVLELSCVLRCVCVFWNDTNEILYNIFHFPNEGCALKSLVFPAAAPSPWTYWWFSRAFLWEGCNKIKENVSIAGAGLSLFPSPPQCYVCAGEQVCISACVIVCLCAPVAS